MTKKHVLSEFFFSQVRSESGIGLYWLLEERLNNARFSGVFKGYVIESLYKN
jgi:hypothetical protein